MITESPLTGGKVILHKEPDKLTFRNEEFAYMSYEYECVDTGQRFTDSELDWKNMEQVYEQYRKKHNIPSPAELTAMREKYGLSAIKMAQVLGLGVNQYAKYEQGEMPSESIGKMLRSIQTPAVFMGYLEDAKNQFSEEEYKKICAKVQKSFLKIIKSKPDLSWFWELLTPPRVLGRVAL